MNSLSTLLILAFPAARKVGAACRRALDGTLEMLMGAPRSRADDGLWTEDFGPDGMPVAWRLAVVRQPVASQRPTARRDGDFQGW